MSNMFRNSKFKGEISKWDVGKVRDMSGMFSGSEFNGEISKWDVGKVRDMSGMFSGSEFNGDISKWDVSNVTNMSNMFRNSKFKGEVSKWDVSNVRDMSGMFSGSKFNGEIGKWDVSKVRDISKMFKGSKFSGDISKWEIMRGSIETGILLKIFKSREEGVRKHILNSERIKYGLSECKKLENFNEERLKESAEEAYPIGDRPRGEEDISSVKHHQKELREKEEILPIWIIEKKGKRILLDGAHRIVASYIEKKKTIPAYVIRDRERDG